MRGTVAVLALFLLGAVTFAAGCGSGEDDEDPTAGESYAIEVEGLSDAAYEAAQNALVTLNGVADGSRSAPDARRALTASSAEVRAQAQRLAGLSAPEDAASVADDLEFQLNSLARAIDSVATDVASAAADDLADAGSNGARLVLAAQSGTSALSRALRRLAVETDA